MGKLLFVVGHERPDMLDALKRHGLAAEHFDVILDRRRRERRQRALTPPTERRRGERRAGDVRTQLDALGFAIISGPGPAHEAPARPTDTTSFLASLPAFEGFSPDQLAALGQRVSERTLRRGQVLFHERAPGGEMFFVRQGTVVIAKTVTEKVEKVLARMQPGDFFGEMSLFGRLPRSATAWAETDALLLALDRDSLQHVIEQSPRAGLAFFTSLVQEFSRRLAATDDVVAEVTRWGLEATGLAEGLE